MENLEIKVGDKVYIKLDNDILYLRDRPKYTVKSIKTVTKHNSNYGSSTEVYNEYIATLNDGTETGVSNLIPITEGDAQDNSIQIDGESIESYNFGDLGLVKKIEKKNIKKETEIPGAAIEILAGYKYWTMTCYSLTFKDEKFEDETFEDETQIHSCDPSNYNGLFDIVVTQNNKELFTIKPTPKPSRPKPNNLFDGGRRKSRKQTKSKKQRKSRKSKRRKSRKY